jgi:hypothetical protein
VNKNELVHLHALLVRVAEAYVEWGVATHDDLAGYRALGTTPMALRQSRADHEAATRLLARTLAGLSDAADDDRAGSDGGSGPAGHDEALEDPTLP